MIVVCSIGTEAINVEETKNVNNKQNKISNNKNYYHEIKNILKHQKIEYMKNKLSYSYDDDYLDYYYSHLLLVHDN